ncbi:MAG: hypothetical protein J6Z49_12190 [Kiritimatiellae bacterium]|nr:hypothetical protein [Kiritimatiellia bacterium]
MSEGRKCPDCSASLAPDAKFCPLCGKKVAAGGAVHQERDAAAGGAAEAPSFAPFELAVAFPEAMQVARRSNVTFRFRAHADLYESVTFVLRCGQKEIARQKCCEGRPSTSEHETVVPITPEVCGDAYLELELSCRLDGHGGTDTEVHTASFSVPVDAKRETPSFQLGGIALGPSITAGHATDAKIDLGGVHFNVSGQESGPKDEATRYTARGVFKPLATQLKRSPGRLTLACGDEVLQLLSDETVTFGRSRKTTVPLLICGPNGRVDPALNMCNQEGYLSRFQFTLKREETEFFILDGKDGENRSNGVRVNGRELPPHGKERLAAGRGTDLDVGLEGHGIRLRVTPHCDPLGNAAGFVLERFDGARQRVYAVWRSLPIGEGERVMWDGCSWHLARDGAADIPLSIGCPVSIGGKTFAVQLFHKTHLH